MEQDQQQPKEVQLKETVVEAAEDIYANDTDDVEYAVVDGFKPGQRLRIGSISAGDMLEWAEANEGPAKKTAGLRLLCKSIVNSKGERIFADPKNIERFRAKPFKHVNRIVQEIVKLNGFDTVAAAAKNG